MMPTRKVSVGAIAGATSVLVVWGLNTWGKTPVPPEIASAFTALVSGLLSYVVPDAEEAP